MSQYPTLCGFSHSLATACGFASCEDDVLIWGVDSESVDPPYPVYGGIFREEAVMLLRRFYVQENEKGTCWGLH